MHKPHGPYEKYFKRPLDFILGVLTIIAFSWLYIILVVLGIFFMRGNPFFLQERPGKNEKIFKLVKFRTMDNRKDKNGVLLPDEIRLNRYGKFLRSTSLDELPEIFNIIKGDMSIIGNSSLLVRYLPYYSTEEHHRHDVRPGLTGYAQVHGRNYVSWEEKFKMDIKYVNTISFKGDFKIITDTIKTVLKRENIETASSIVHDGVLYQPLDVERSSINKEGE